MKNRERKYMGGLLAFSLNLLFVAAMILFASPAEAGMVMAASPVIDLAGACSNILVYIESLAQGNNPFYFTKRTGALDYITSPLNGGVKADLVSVDNGRKLARAKVVYKSRIKACDMVDTRADICGTCTPELPKEANVVIEHYVGSKCYQFSNADMINICQDTTSFVNEYVVSAMAAGRQKVDEIILAAMKAAVGTNHRFDGTVTPAGQCSSVQVLSSAGGQVVPLFGNYTNMLLDFQSNQLSGTPVFIGEGFLWQFSMLANMACCNATIPYDSAVLSAQAAIYLDQAANKVLGANQILMTTYGAAHLLWFNENRNINIDTPTSKHIVIPDPVNPALAWDLDFIFDDCTKTWKFNIGAWMDVFHTIQADAFGSDVASPGCEDDLVGLTGIFCYNLTNA